MAGTLGFFGSTRVSAPITGYVHAVRDSSDRVEGHIAKGIDAVRT
jgi:hypothetical protein